MKSMFTNIFNKKSDESEMVRLFRTEYFKEYKQAKAYGVDVNTKFVKEFLNLR